MTVSSFVSGRYTGCRTMNHERMLKHCTVPAKSKKRFMVPSVLMRADLVCKRAEAQRHCPSMMAEQTRALCSGALLMRTLRMVGLADAFPKETKKARKADVYVFWDMMVHPMMTRPVELQKEPQ